MMRYSAVFGNFFKEVGGGNGISIVFVHVAQYYN